MMTIPSVGMYNDIAIFPDDENVNYYYCIRTTPHLRLMNGKPVFVGVFWTNRNATTAAEAVKLSGGTINFDVNLGLSKDEVDAITQMIDSNGIRNNRIDTLKAQMQSVKLHEKDTTQHFRYNYVLEKGTVEIRPIQYTKSTIEVKEHEGGAEVLFKSDGQSCALGDNNAAYSMALSAIGAETWYRCLMKDSRAIAVAFNLSYKVRIPSITMRIHAAHYTQSEMKGKIKWWTKCNKKADYASITKSLIDSGIITIDIVKGDTEIPQEYIDKIWQSLFSIVERKVQQIFEEKYASMSVEDFESHKDEYLWEDMTSFIDIEYNQRDVIELTSSPQANLVNFLSDLTAEDKKTAVQLIDLRNPVLKPKREVEFSANAPWEYVTQVIVEATCGGESKSFTFTKIHTEDKWTLEVTGDDLKKIEYVTKVNFMDRPMNEYVTFPKQTSLGNIHVDVGNIGKIDLLFKPYPGLSSLEGDSKVKSLILDITYPVLGGGTSTYSKPISLDETGDQKFTKVIPTIITQPLKFTTRYEFEGAKPVTIKDKLIYPGDLVSTNPIYVPKPFNDTLDLNVSIPAIASESGVTSVEVDFKYEDSKNDFSSRGSVTLNSTDHWAAKQAHIPIVDPNQVDFEYQFVINGKQVFQSDWLKGHGEASRLIIPVQVVRVSCAALKLGELYQMGLFTVYSPTIAPDAVICVPFQLDTNNPGTNMLEFFTDDISREYHYELTLYDMNAKEYKSTGSWKGLMFMIPPPAAQTE